MAEVELINTGHEDMIHDSAFDHYGRYLATCSSDASVKVFELRGGQQSQLADLREHRGPVWQVAWAPPRFGAVLASASYDHRAVVWSQQQCSDGKAYFIKMHDFTGHTSSVNGVDWAPQEGGLRLATASSDATVAVVTHKEGGVWETEWVCEAGSERAHNIGVNAVAWAPAPVGAEAGAATLRLATAGADNMLKLWRRDAEEGKWARECVLGPADGQPEYPDWVRDVAFCPNPQHPGATVLACCSQNKVYIWRQLPGDQWKLLSMVQVGGQAWKVAWQECEGLLAVTAADGKVTVFKQRSVAQPDEWHPLTVVDNNAPPAP